VASFEDVTLTFIKLGGSVITDKTGQEAADLATIRRLAGELRDARAADPSLRIILGHGSGSFGHTYAARYGIHQGIAPGGDWMGFALTAAAALRLNRIVVDELLAAGVPALSLQPSTTLQSVSGRLVAWDSTTIGRALGQGLMPVVHGDVAFDAAQGSTIISTEQLLLYLVQQTTALRPTRVILVGEAGVYSADPRANPAAQRIPLISQANIAAVLQAAGGSHGVDVTGGMRAKVELLWRMVEAQPGLSAQLIGTESGLLRRALLGQAAGEGTTITAG
jgi:isopentenyl phosphate kinase